MYTELFNGVRQNYVIRGQLVNVIYIYIYYDIIPDFVVRAIGTTV